MGLKFADPLYHAVDSKFREKNGCALVVNISFNSRGDRIICVLKDTLRCFMGS